MKCLLLIFLLTPAFVFGANHCVTPSGAGAMDGTDWSNAYAGIPTALTRGDTYYIADGDYSSTYTFDDAPSADQVITIKKATEGEHGPETGWVSTLGDGVATFGQWQVAADDLLIDGVTGGGPGSWQSGHGIKFSTNYVRLLWFTSAVDNITVQRCEFAFPTSETTDDNAADHIYGNVSVTNFTLEYCYLHDSSRVFILSRAWEDVTVRYNWFARNRSTAGRHAEGWSDHNGLRYEIAYNYWEDIEGTGCTVMLFGDGYDWNIHGNIVFWSGDANYTGFGNGCFTTRSSLANAYNWQITNNTVIDGKGFNVGHRIHNGSGNASYNNLFYNCPAVNMDIEGTTDYNWYIQCTTVSNPGTNDIEEPSGADPFVDEPNEDFQLSAPSSAGYSSLTSPLTVDLNGTTRGTDGVWDIGAFEYNNSSNSLIPSGTITIGP